MDPLLLKRLEKSPSLPTLPTIAIDLLALCERDDLDLVAVARRLAMDPSMTARLLRMANSAAFAPLSEVRTASHAVAMLGMNAVRTLALSFSLVDAMKGSAGVRFDYEAYWRRSLLSALASRELARLMNPQLAEEAFLAGLLQDIGVLALARGVGGPYEALFADAGADHARLLELEREHLGTDHLEVGAWLLARWKLPRGFGDAVLRSHGTPPAVGTVELAVATSGLLADVWIAGGSIDSLARLDDAEAARPELKGITLSAFAAMARSALNVAELFAVNIGTPPDVPQLLDRAREALVLQTARAARLAQQDGLTGVLMRAPVEQQLQHLFDRSRASDRPLSLLFIDVDRFKAVNDTYGHAVGDQVLVGVADLLAKATRTNDVVGRWGGEEFVVLLPGTALEGAMVVAERARASTEGHTFRLPDGVQLRVTLSVGVATNVGGRFMEARDLLASADEAVYTAKHEGRNRVVAAPVEVVSVAVA